MSVALCESLEPERVHTAVIDRPMFTFIDHDDDLSSKRIRDANARKAIRSHVMRDVRRRERLAGLKRTSKRETRPKQTESSSAIIPMHSESAASAYLLGAESASPSSAASSLPDTEVAFGRLNSQQGRWRPTVWRAGHLVPPTPAPSPLAFPPSWLLDPFDTLPGAGETPSMVARLVFYCELSLAFSRREVNHYPPWEYLFPRDGEIHTIAKKEMKLFDTPPGHRLTYSVDKGSPSLSR